MIFYILIFIIVTIYPDNIELSIKTKKLFVIFFFAIKTVETRGTRKGNYSSDHESVEHRARTDGGE